MSSPPTRSALASIWRWPRRLHAALMPDYPLRAALYWWLVVAAGSVALAGALPWLWQQPGDLKFQVLFGCAVTMLAGLFPVRVPGSKNSFAAGEVFIMLLLLMHGPHAAALAAAGESFVGSARSSRRWTSRLISPAVAAISMTLAGRGFEAVKLLAVNGTVLGEGLVLVAAMGAAVAHFALTAAMITVVPHLKAGQWPRLADLVSNFAWVGTTFAASAVVAGLLYLAFKASGIGVMAGAVPIIILLLVMLHYHFRQRESDERAQALRVEAAEREAEQSARHLQALRESEQRFHSAFSHAAIGMALVSSDGRVLQANPALCTLLACRLDELVAHEFQRWVLPEDRQILQRQWQSIMARDGTDSAVEIRCLKADGEQAVVALHSGHFSDRDASLPCLILQAQDITDRRRAEAQLHHIAYHDSLTSLANRIRFGHCLDQAIARCKSDGRYHFAVMYLDFDRFKLINDTLGHSAGDRFLTLVAERIRGQVRPVDIVGRLGGDEFAILVDDLDDEAEALQMADRLQKSFSQPFDLDGTELRTSASIGITFSTIGYDKPGDVLRDADIAMYRAKAAGRARTALFDASLRAQLAEQVNLERELRHAIERQELTLAYQPIYSLKTGALDSFEALVRWTHPDLGPVPPSTFVPVAEDSAMIAALTEWVLGAACAQLKALQQLPGLARKPRVHVNVSGTDMCRPQFVTQVATALLANGLEPQQLTLEITESTLMHRLDAALEVMGKLREIGVGLSVDDFGTGYSSLSYLSTLPITSLKIDRSFVQRLRASQVDCKDNEVVRAVITLGQALGKTVIAEGIETPAQLEQLRAMGCELGQGYLLARPLTADMACTVALCDHGWGAEGLLPTEGDDAPTARPPGVPGAPAARVTLAAAVTSVPAAAAPGAAPLTH